MKKFGLILIAFFIVNITINAQVIYPEDPDTSEINDEANKSVKIDDEQNQKTDVLYQHDGETIAVDVKRIYLNDLYYSLPGETKVNRIDQRLVHKIVYKTGKIEVLNEKAPEVREVGDYRKVKVTKDPDDVEGLIEVAKLEAKTDGGDVGNTSIKSLERSAIIVLRRKAALVNGHIVLITDKKSTGGFGETPSLTLYGIAYSYR